MASLGAIGFPTSPGKIFFFDGKILGIFPSRWAPSLVK